MKDLTLPKGKKVYFASDNHLGAPTNKDSMPREKKFVAWLDSIKQDAAAIFLMGDLFDFWFEYKTVIPKDLPERWASWQNFRIEVSKSPILLATMISG